MINFLASVSGLIGGVLLWAQFALSVRPVSRLLTHDYAKLIKLHIWLGTWGVLMVFMHPVLELFAYGMVNWSFWQSLFVPSFDSEFAKHLAFGQIALILLLVVWLSSAVFRSKLTYRPWKYVHYLSYPSMFLVFIHAKDIGSMLAQYPLLDYGWTLLMLSFLVLVAWRIADALLLTKAKYTLNDVTKVTDGLTAYTLVPTGDRRVEPKVGQYVYLTTKPFGEAHPFTVMHFDAHSGALTFGIKSFGSFTKKLAHKGAVDKHAKLYLDGPYGAFTQEGQNAEPKVLIAGGIGVTPFIQLVEEFGNDATYMLNCNKTLESAIEREALKAKLGSRYIDVIEPNLLSQEVLQGHLPEEYFTEAKFFICGPKGLMQAAEKHLKALGVSPSRIFTEAFSF